MTLGKYIIPLLISTSVSANEAPQTPYGWVEHGSILPNNIMLEMKLDTGAKSSSIDADNIDYHRKNDEKWVKFDVNIKNNDTGKITSTSYDLPVKRKVEISGAGGEDHRPVVLLDICINGKILKNEEFTLANRSKKKYPVLIGRSTLEHMGALVDPSKMFLSKNTCDNVKK
ncbi:RimK/LysX family protein [Aeromonas hydrophila]|uniref:ATP-dependent zinc protease family protein n=1 Tax=Aeromonas hydrophila TaxID=644 RepID=UPI00249E3181|nr:RimK/LysX family protein [Aeromonas hydrophila]WGY30799.1 RimK/LysX family protein [Aeromonas hydrophila]HDC4321952.1 ATP-dependent zinc protease [Aeromonas hydrophila]